MSNFKGYINPVSSMAEIELDSDRSFKVQESSLINIIGGIICVALFFGVLVTRNFERGMSTSSFYLIYIFFLLGAIMCFTKAYRRSTILYINANGIYYKSEKVTDWKNFVSAYIMQEEYNTNDNSNGLSDKFNVMVTFFNPTAGANYVYQMRMSNIQDKSEYEVIEAIEYFSGIDISTHIY